MHFSAKNAHIRGLSSFLCVFSIKIALIFGSYKAIFSLYTMLTNKILCDIMVASLFSFSIFRQSVQVLALKIAKEML